MVGVIIASLLVGAILVGVGFYLFEPASFLENLVAESIGLAFALAVIVWLVEGPVLTRQRRVRAILEYKRRVFQLGGEIGTLIVNAIADPIATDFEPPIDLYGDERGNGTNLNLYSEEYSRMQWMFVKMEFQPILLLMKKRPSRS